MDSESLKLMTRFLEIHNYCVGNYPALEQRHLDTLSTFTERALMEQRPKPIHYTPLSEKEFEILGERFSLLGARYTHAVLEAAQSQIEERHLVPYAELYKLHTGSGDVLLG